MKTQALIERLPKAELHMHLEGSLEPELMFELARRNDVSIPFDSVEQVRAAYEFSNLQEFLDIYYQGMAVLQTPADFEDLTLAYCRRAHADQVRHVEVFFDPQGHTERGVSMDTVVHGIIGGLARAQEELGLSHKLIMCFLRHLDEAAAFDTLREAEPFLEHLAGVGLDSSEVGHPPSKFARVFAECGKHGLRRVAHAGEEGPPEYVWQALDELAVERIDHGNRALEDPALVERLVASAMPLTVCPLSNLKLCVVSDMQAHPLRNMLDQRLNATVNSDDPAYFGGYMNANFAAVAESLELESSHLAQLAANSFTSSWLSDAEKQPFLDEIDLIVTEFGAL
ncbi:MAG: adenosine deaminase [Pseudomonadota bacterium]